MSKGFNALKGLAGAGIATSIALGVGACTQPKEPITAEQLIAAGTCAKDLKLEIALNQLEETGYPNKQRRNEAANRITQLEIFTKVANKYNIPCDTNKKSDITPGANRAEEIAISAIQTGFGTIELDARTKAIEKKFPGINRWVDDPTNPNYIGSLADGGFWDRDKTVPATEAAKQAAIVEYAVGIVASQTAVTPK